MSARFTFRSLVVGTALSLVISLGFSYARRCAPCFWGSSWALVDFLVGGTGNFVPVFTHHT